MGFLGYYIIQTIFFWIVSPVVWVKICKEDLTVRNALNILVLGLIPIATPLCIFIFFVSALVVLWTSCIKPDRVLIKGRDYENNFHK